jgi:hypothetical protein
MVGVTDSILDRRSDRGKSHGFIALVYDCLTNQLLQNWDLSNADCMTDRNAGPSLPLLEIARYFRLRTAQNGGR